MKLAQLYERVAARLADEVEVNPAELVHVVLTLLAERLTPDEAAELGAELPEELGDILARARGDGTLARDEFIEALAAQLDLDDDTAESSATAVLKTLREALEPVTEIDQVLETLPTDLQQLMS